MKVLIAEDEPVPRMILEATLQDFGHECLVAEDGLQAWEIYGRVPGVDVVISDWMMPGMDGLELCRNIRAEGREDGYTYFIFLTALDDRGHLLSGMQEGADDYLRKPLDPEELQVRMIAASRVTSLHRLLADQKAELFEQSRKDPMTRLGNRLSLHEDVEVLRGRVERYGHGYCALLCDVDHFKDYNDHYGHLAGDDVLRRVADILVEHSRAGDKVYRYGGEEFLIIVPEKSLRSATIAADRVRRAVEELDIPHEAGGVPGIVTISVGVAALSQQDFVEDADALLRRADEALYRAKESGRNRVVVYESAIKGSR